MNKLFLIRNPIVFQGEKFLNKRSNYFEGWYFKNTNGNETISFIPGISIDGDNREAFIQVITGDSSYYVYYDIGSFDYSFDPFFVKVGDNCFSIDGIHIAIRDKKSNLKIVGDLKYSNSQGIKSSLLSPNIMGPFSYIPFMECNHAVLSMKNKVNGIINFNDNEICIRDGIGYIEKDFGTSFPKSYIWIQGNNFCCDDVSFMLSIAHIPFKIFQFRGLICILKIGNKEYKFTTYNNSKIIKYDIDNGCVDIVLKKNSYTLIIHSKYDLGYKLSAPVKGRMVKDILESITSKIEVVLMKKDKFIFNDSSLNCGVEIVNNNCL